MEIHLKVDDQFEQSMRELKAFFETDSNGNLVRKGLGLLKWAAEEVKAGRIIASADADGSNLKRMYLKDP